MCRRIPPDGTNNWKEARGDFVSGELLTSAFGHFTEELPVVFLLTPIENCEKVGKSPPLPSALGYDCNAAADG